MTDSDPESESESEQAAEIDRELSEINQAAQDDYDTETVVDILEFLEDAYADIDTASAYREGFSYALYHVQLRYIQDSGEYPCACPVGWPTPEKRRSGWYCAECEEFLAAETDVPGTARHPEVS